MIWFAEINPPQRRPDGSSEGSLWLASRQSLAARRDRQLTRVGRFLRDARFDCLPQLINVVRGDMSVIRGGPERPHFLD